MWSCENEYVPIQGKVVCEGPVEQWLTSLLAAMKESVKYQLDEAFQSFSEQPRNQWMERYPAQVVQLVTQVLWTQDVNEAFDRLDSGIDTAMKEYLERLKTSLEGLTKLVTQPELSANERQKLISLITVEVHNRFVFAVWVVLMHSCSDIVAQLIRDGVESKDSFVWQSQLRYEWRDRDCTVLIADAKFNYQYEYLGNMPRIVITPLTDRCCMSLTLSHY